MPLVVFVLIGLVYLGFEVGSGWRALASTAYFTARPASKEIGVFAAGVVCVGLLALASPFRVRILAIVAPLLVFAAVILATAILGGHALAMVDALLTMLALWFTGDWLLRRLGLVQLAEHRVVAWVAGIAPLLVLSTVLGRLSLFRWWDMGLLIVVLGLAGAVRSAQALLVQRRALIGALTADAVSAVSAGALVLTATVASVYTAAPEVQYDPLYAKAYLPILWARTGHIGALDNHVQLAVTGWFQIVAAWGNLLGAAATGRYLQLLAYLAIPAAIWAFARRRGVLAPLAAAAVGMIPMLFLQATTADDDVLIALGAVGIIIATLTALGSDFTGSERTTALVLGVLVGTGWSMKTHVIPMATMLLIGWVLSTRGRAARLARLGWVLPGLVVAGGLPIILRWIDTGNPVFPSYNNIFKSPDWLPVNEAFNFPFWPNAHAVGFLKAPIEAVFNPALMGENLSPGGFGAFAGLVLVAALIGWRWRRRVPGSLVLWVALVVAILVWWSEFRYLRYFLPEGLLATLLLISVGSRVALPARRLVRGGLVVCVVLGTIAYLSVSVADLATVPNHKVPIKAALGIWHATDYLTTAYPERPALLEFNRVSSSRANVLTDAFERTWLTGDRNIYEGWEATDLSEAHHMPFATIAESVAAVHRLGINWVLTDPVDGVDYLSWITQLAARQGSVRFAANGWTLFQLTGHPQTAHPLAACDRTGAGLPAACWQGTRNASGQITGTATRSLAVCPGEILDVKVTQAADQTADGVNVDLPQMPADVANATESTTPGGTADIYDTVLGASTQATVSIDDPAGAGITTARVDTIGSCSHR